VNLANNTVARNITTATAVTSDGAAAPAGLSTGANSDPLQARLRDTTVFPGSSILGNTLFSKPAIMNDVFWDNRAGYINSTGGVSGITAADANSWDMGAADLSGVLSPINSVVQTPLGTLGTDGGSATVRSDDPVFKSPFDVAVNILPLRTYPGFRQAVIVALIVPPSLMGDYHLLNTTSPAYGRGTGSIRVRWGASTETNPWVYLVAAPNRDIDGNNRPSLIGGIRRFDAGSDQFQP